MKKLLLLFVVAVASMSLAVAAPLCSLGIADVMTPGSECELGGLLFNGFNVSGAPPVPTVSVGTLSQVVGNNVQLQFTISPSTGWTDAVLTYAVTGSILGVSTGTTTAGATIIEDVCKVWGSTCALPDQLATVSWPTDAGPKWFDPQQPTVYITKDIYPGTAGLSHLTNSHYTPEPMSFVLMGTGLLGLGLIRRVRK